MNRSAVLLALALVAMRRVADDDLDCTDRHH